MKFKSLYLASIAVLGFAMAACDGKQDTSYTPAAPVESPQCYFAPAESGQVFEVGEDDSEVTINIYRGESADSITVPVTFTGTDTSLFTVPADVTFAEGQQMAEIVVSFDATALQGAKPYDITLAVGDGENSPYFLQTITNQVLYFPWVDVVGPNGEQYASYEDALIGKWFNVPNPSVWNVKLQMSPAVEGLYRLVNPYGAACPYNEPADYDSSKNYYVYFNTKNPDAVFLCTDKGEVNEPDGSLLTIHTGMNWGYGEFLMSGYYNFRAQAGNAAGGAMYLGKNTNGYIVFPEQSILGFMTEYSTSWGYSPLRCVIRFPGAAIPAADVEWESIGACDFTDPYILPLFNDETDTWSVEVEKNIKTPGVFRIVNAYEPFSDGFSEDYYTEIDCTDPTYVELLQQNTGLVIDETLGDTYIMNIAGAAGRVINMTAEQVVAGGYVDTYDESTFFISLETKNGRVRFPNSTDEDILPNKLYVGQTNFNGGLQMTAAAAAQAKVSIASNLNYTKMLTHRLNENGLGNAATVGHKLPKLSKNIRVK